MKFFQTKLFTLVLIALLSTVLVACGEDKQADKKTAINPETDCANATKQKPKTVNLSPPAITLDPSKTYQAVVETNCGSFTITLDTKLAPKTTASFFDLAKDGFYDGLTFHRIIDGFVIQAGDPLGSGRGGPGYSVIEKPADTTKYTRGVVAMAKTELEEPGTSGSQFFVVTGEDAGLPADYAVLGKVTAGSTVLDRINAVDTDPTDESPLTPVVINSIRLLPNTYTTNSCSWRLGAFAAAYCQ